MELFSLATFEPDRATSPYLNTPRSIEACRLNGVSPRELVVISYKDIEKEFPNDPAAAQKKYNRVEASRIRALAAVTKEWKKLKKAKWKPSHVRPRSAKERILDVPEGIYKKVFLI